MKGEYLKDKQDHNPNSNNMFAKLHQTQKFHHHVLSHPPLSPPEPAFHHPFHVTTTASAAAAMALECETSEEADSPTITKKEGMTMTIPTTNDGGSIEVVRRPRGRPPGSKNKPKPPVIITRDAEPSMSPYILELPSGVDIISAVERLCRKRNICLCILNGSGAVTNVTLRRPPNTTASPPGATVTFHGRFDILSLSATILSPNTHTHAQVRDDVNGFTISLAGPQGQVFGGSVTGKLTSAGVVYLIAATFNNPSYQRLPLEDEGARHATASPGGGSEVGHHSQAAAAASSGGGDGGRPPAGAAVYSCHLPSDVIWAPTARPPPPY